MAVSGKKPGRPLKLSKENAKQLRELKPRKDTNVKGGARPNPVGGRVDPSESEGEE